VFFNLNDAKLKTEKLFCLRRQQQSTKTLCFLVARLYVRPSVDTYFARMRHISLLSGVILIKLTTNAEKLFKVKKSKVGDIGGMQDALHFCLKS